MKKLSFTKIWFEPTPVAEQVHYGASIFTGFFGSFYVRKNTASPPLAGEPQITWVFPRRRRRRGGNLDFSEAVDPGRIELPFLPCEGSVLPLDYRPDFFGLSGVAPELNPPRLPSPCFRDTQIRTGATRTRSVRTTTILYPGSGNGGQAERLVLLLHYSPFT